MNKTNNARIVGGRFDLDEIKIEGRVSMRQGDKILCRDARNHFVDAGLKGIISQIIFSQFISTDYIYYHWSSAWHIYIGSDTTTPTVTTMTELQSPIGTAPGTAPDSKTITSIHDGSPDGDWYAIWQATWNPGSVSGTVGEAALYMRAPDRSTFRWDVTYGYTPAEVMVSRVSSADTDFSSFVINTSLPLTVDWKIRWYFG